MGRIDTLMYPYLKAFQKTGLEYKHIEIHPSDGVLYEYLVVHFDLKLDYFKAYIKRNNVLILAVIEGERKDFIDVERPIDPETNKMCRFLFQ